jgi:spermidine synthase
MPMTLAELFPEAKIDVVEIDEAVARVAKDYFKFRESDNMRIVVKDARVHVKRSVLQGNTYDFIVLDAFTGDYIPEHLMTQEFFEEVKSILEEDGVIVSNTFSTSDLYDHESETYKAVYGSFINFKMPITGNRVVIASKNPLPSDRELRERAAAWEESLKPYNIEITEFPRHMSRGQDWDHHKRPLTDQYSPANLLRR